MKKGTSTAISYIRCSIIVLSIFETSQDFVRFPCDKTVAVTNTKQQQYQPLAAQVCTVYGLINIQSWNFFPGSLLDCSGAGYRLAEGYAAAILKIYGLENKLKRPRARENFTACFKRLELTEILCLDDFFSSCLQCFSPASLSFYVMLFPSYLLNILLPSHELTTVRAGKHTCLFYVIQAFQCTA